MKTNSKLVAGVVFVTALLAGTAISLGGAQASGVYTENFDAGFQGDGPFFSPTFDDKNLVTNLYSIVNNNNWTFSSYPGDGTFFSLAGTNGSVLLNEFPNGVGTAATTVSGFVLRTRNTPSASMFGVTIDPERHGSSTSPRTRLLSLRRALMLGLA